MDRFDREILDFIRSWAPFGGPPADEVLERFGMTRDELTERCQVIVGAEAARRERELRQPWRRMSSAASTKGR